MKTKGETGFYCIDVVFTENFVSMFTLTESGLAREDTDLYSDTSSVGDNSEYASSTSSRGSRSSGQVQVKTLQRNIQLPEILTLLHALYSKKANCVQLHVRESKTFLDSGFHVTDSGFEAFDSGLFFSGTWIPDSLSSIPDSKTQDSGFHGQFFPDSEFHKPKFRGLRNPDSLTLGDVSYYTIAKSPTLVTRRVSHSF